MEMENLVMNVFCMAGFKTDREGEKSLDSECRGLEQFSKDSQLVV